MPSQFDAYHQWLSIPPKDQPADHYRLLGLTQFEASAEKIDKAATKRVEYLRTFQTGDEAKECERLQGEVEHARKTLLDPRRKAVYDALLRTATSTEVGQPAPESGKAGLLTAGESIGRFKLLAVDRETRLAVTCKVEDPTGGRVYSLKMLSLTAAADARVCKRFEREVEISQRLHHPNLITGYESGKHNGIPYLVTEQLTGTDLQTLVEKCGPFPIDQAIELVEQAACGLGQLHLLGVHHRNVSPRNLLLDIQGRVRVSNLLLAGIEEGTELDDDESLTRTGEAMGSSDFMAPEQVVDASAADQRADIYSLGCTLFYLLTGRVPYGGRGAMEKALAHRNNPIPSLQDHCPDAPAWVDRVFQKMIAKQPEDRYQSMAEVSQALLPGRAQRGTRWHPILLGGVGVGLVTVAVLVMAITGWLGGSAEKADEESVPERQAAEVVEPAGQKGPVASEGTSGPVIPQPTVASADQKPSKASVDSQPMSTETAVVPTEQHQPATPNAPTTVAKSQPPRASKVESADQASATRAETPAANPSSSRKAAASQPLGTAVSPADKVNSKPQSKPVASSEMPQPPATPAASASKTTENEDSSDSWVPPLATSEDLTKRKWPYVSPVPNRVIDESKVTYFVSLDGDDSHDGRTRKTAFATMQHAADVVKPGDTVLVTKGVYHAGFHIAKRGSKDAWITFIADPGAEIRGTEVRRDWQREPGDLPIYSIDWQLPAKRALTDESFPLRDQMEQAFSEGRLLQQVPDFAALRPRGTFFVDNAKKRFSVCLPREKNPNEVNTEVTSAKVGWPGWAIAVGGRPNANFWEKESIGLQNQAAYIRIDGFTVRNIANFSRMAAIQIRGLCDHILVENCDVQWTNQTGIAASGMLLWSKTEKKWIDHPCRDVVIRNCIASNNGHVGVSGNVDRMQAICNILDANNFKDFRWAGEGGAAKLVHGSHLLMRGNVSRNNYNANGLWFDYGGENGIIEDNFVFNTANGIHNEVTPHPVEERSDDGRRGWRVPSAEEVKRWKAEGTIIRRNVISGCKASGVYISTSCNAQVYNNIFYQNAEYGIWFGGAYDRPGTNGQSGNRAYSNICDCNRWHAGMIPENYAERFFDNQIGRNLYGTFSGKLPFMCGEEVSVERWRRIQRTASQDVNAPGELFRKPEKFDFTLRLPRLAAKVGFDAAEMRLDWSEFFVPAYNGPVVPEVHRLSKRPGRAKRDNDCIFRASFDHDVLATYSDGAELLAGGINPYCYDAGRFIAGPAGVAIVPESAMIFPVPEDFPQAGQGAILLRLRMDDWRTVERKAEETSTGANPAMRPLAIGPRSSWRITFEIDKKTWNILTLRVVTGNEGEAVDVTDKIKSGQWFQLLMNWGPDSKNPKGSVRRVYLNGQLLLEKHCRDKLPLSEGPMYLGSPQNNEWRWRGAMDQVRIYRRALSDQEIQQMAVDLDGNDKASSRRKR